MIKSKYEFEYTNQLYINNITSSLVSQARKCRKKMVLLRILGVDASHNEYVITEKCRL